MKYVQTGKTIYEGGRGLANLGQGIFLKTPTAPQAPEINYTPVSGPYTPVSGPYTPVSGPSTPAPAPNSTPNTDAPTGSGFSWGDAVPYLNGALSIYNAYNILRNKNLSPTERNLALGGTAASASIPWTGAWGSAAATGFNVGAILAGKGTEEEKTQQAAHNIGMGFANYFTGGLAGLGDAFARNQWGGTMKKIDKFRFNTPGTPEWGITQLSRLWDTDKWKTEGKRLGKLLDSGVYIPEAFQGARSLKRGRRKEELINPYLPKDYIGATPQYGWVNNKFASSRSEADLRPEDIWGYAAFAEKIPDWFKKYTPQQKLSAAKKLLDAKAVNEHHGTIDINWNPQLEADVNTILGRSNMVPKATPKPSPPAVGVTPPASPVTNNRKGFLARIR
jgi:hypothetical protein